MDKKERQISGVGIERSQIRKTQLSLWVRKDPDSKDDAACLVQPALSRSEDLNSLSKVRLASSMRSFTSLTGFAVLGELEAEGASRLSKSRSSNMSTAESAIQDTASRIANAF